MKAPGGGPLPAREVIAPLGQNECWSSVPSSARRVPRKSWIRPSNARRAGVQLNEHKQGKKTLAVEQIVRACTEIVKRRRVAGLVNFRLETEVSERAVRAWRARPARSKSRTRPTIAAQKTTGTGLEFLCHEPPARALAAATSAPGLARAGQHRTRLWPVNRPPAWLVATVFEN